MVYFNKYFHKSGDTISKIVRLLFYSFPIILFFSSTFLNFHVTLLTFFGLVAIYKVKIKFNLSFIDYLILFFFLINLIATINNISTLGYEIFIKSILSFRFFLLIWVVRNLLLSQIVNIKLLSIISLISSILLSLDIFLQHLLGYDIFGFEPFSGRYNGFFEHEAIAGSYLQKFFTLSILVILISSIKKIIHGILISSVVNIIGLAILLSFDRMPFFIFVLILFLFLFFLKNFRLIFILNILILSIIFAYLIKNSENLRNRYEYTNRDINFNKILKLPQIQKYSDIFIPDLRISNFNEKDQLFHGDYAKLFRSAYFTSSKNNFIGTGHKSFFFECMKLNLKDISCNIHPHNIYLEVLVNTGIIGLFVFIIILLLSLHKILKLLFKDSINKTQNIILISFLVYFIAEFIPFRTYGSIFSTFNGTIFWFFFAIISFLNKTELKKKLI